MKRAMALSVAFILVWLGLASLAGAADYVATQHGYADACRTKFLMWSINIGFFAWLITFVGCGLMLVIRDLVRCGISHDEEGDYLVKHV